MKIITRAEWGARPPRSTPARCAWTGSDLWVHHSEGTTPSGSIESSIAVARAIQAFHQGKDRGWNDIGYGYVVDPQGRVFEGRGVGVWAAHCPGHNDEPSVCILGSYQSTAPSAMARTAIWALADHLGMTRLRGHREGYPTTCPGDAAMRTIVNAGRPSPVKPDPAPLPYSNTLRLVIQTSADRKAGRAGRMWAGWDACAGPLQWVRRNGINPSSTCAIAWRGNVWRGPRDVRNVAANLAKRFL